ncbi:hypothetical protein HYX00_00165 [Candidatus Woesearchaeota archaeon]|nr:hypothetical protein [Candidatus Woesearchaeota archaeon]
MINISKEKQQTSSKQIPTGVKVISILGFVGSVLIFIFGLILLVVRKKIPEISLIIGFSDTYIVIYVILLLISGVFGFLVAFNLWKGKKWARIATIVLSAVGLLRGLTSVVMGKFSTPFDFTGILITLFINVLIGGYLSSDKNVKSFFS